MKISEYNKLSKEEKKKVKFRGMPSATKIAVFLVIGFVIIILISMLVDAPKTSDTKQTTAPEVKKPSEYDVYYYSEEAVKMILKAPSTAKFRGRHVWNFGDSEFVVKGNVDAQNAFGAMLRSRYYVKLKYKGTDPNDATSWTIIKSEIEE
jgi:hypothetical protein